MKKYIIILAAAVCALCACQKHEIELLDKPIIEQIDANTYTYTFSAVISDNVSEVEEDGTKATVSRAGAFAWAVDDELKFFKSDNTSANAKITAVDGSTATITVYDVDSRADFVSAIYPASAAVSGQPYKVNFNARGPIVVADIADGGTLTFHHIGSVINLKFYGIDGMDDIKSLVFEPTTPFSYDGSFTFNASHEPSLTSSVTTTSKIVVPASKADNNEDITVVVPSVILSGFSAALNDKADGTGRNLFKKSTATAHDLATKRPVLMNMKRVAYEAPRADLYFLTTYYEGSPLNITDYPLIQIGASDYELWIDARIDATYYIMDSYNVGNPAGALVTGTVLSTSGSTTDEVYLAGVFTSWETDKIKMTKLREGLYHTRVEGAKIGTSHEFKYIFDGGKWFGYGNSNYGIVSGDGVGNLDGLTDNTAYDFLLDTSNNRHFPLEDKSGHFRFSFNGTTLTVTPEWTKRVNTWGNSYFESTGLALSGTMNSWTDSNLNFYGNFNFGLANIYLTGSTSYEFKIKTQGGWTSDNTWGAADVISVNPGTNNYGTGTTPADENGEKMTFTPSETGTYTLYANCTHPWYTDKPLRIMFVKTPLY